MLILRRFLRWLRIRREIQRRLDVNLEFDDLPEDAAAVRNGARLALVALKNWLDGCVEKPAEDVKESRWLDDSDDNVFDVPHVSIAEVGEPCWFYHWTLGEGEMRRAKGTLVRRGCAEWTVEVKGVPIRVS